MAPKVEIDPGAGFCGGVIRAISKAEEYLREHPGQRLWSLGEIVHNEEELSRLKARGLVSVSHTGDVPDGGTMLIRAHGEPPRTYREASSKGLDVIDCTCPVVLALQKKIREAHARLKPLGGQILIFGKVGHAEVLGLVGQTSGEEGAIVLEDMPMAERYLQEGIIRDVPTEVFSQTTKSPDEYRRLCGMLEGRLKGLKVHETICSQVSTRHEALGEFARSHDVLVFVSGSSSSNGRVLSELCLSVNPRTYRISGPSELRKEWFESAQSIGVSGATSTPLWLLEAVKDKIIAIFEVEL